MTTIGSSSLDELRDKCIQSVNSIIDANTTNDYALQRIVKYCTELMPNAVETSIRLRDEREQRNNELKNRSEEFISHFFNANVQYYYLSVPELYIMCVNDTYEPTDEDEISYSVLSSLSKDDKLRVWKHKIKTQILRQIRQTKITDVIPSSTTIQSVIRSIYPSVFQSRTEAKYFLTILGDCLVKKNTNLIYFIHSRAKKFITYIINNLTAIVGNNASSISTAFKFKYCNHTLTDCRLLRVQGYGNTLLCPQVKALDLFFVSQYYSERYSSADKFLAQCPLESPVQHARYFITHTKQDCVEHFFSNVIEKTETKLTPYVNIRNVHFIWKRFLEMNQIPNVLLNRELLPSLLAIPELEEAYKDETFTCYTSKLLPTIDLFMTFWENTIHIGKQDEPNSPNSQTDHNEFQQLEIDEITYLFGSWVRSRTNNASVSTNALIDDEMALALIRHFYPDITVENDKFIYDITCSLWDKEKDVTDFIESYIVETKVINADKVITIDDAYKLYCNARRTEGPCLANKQYFERIYQDITMSS